MVMTTDDDDTRRGKSVQAVGNNGPHLLLRGKQKSGSGGREMRLAMKPLAEVFDQHEIVVEFIALRVENGTLIRSNG